MGKTILDKIVATKQMEVQAAKARVSEKTLVSAARKIKQRQSLVSALASPEVSIIAEIKRASPSKGVFRADLDAAQLAAAYEDAGASAISVLTDYHYFQGSSEDLIAAKKVSRR